MSEQTANPFTPPTASIDAPPQAVVATELAKRGERLIAILLDGLCAFPIMLLFVIAGVFGKDAKTSGSTPMTTIVLGALGALSLLAFAIYQVYLLSTRGQTIGKRWMSIKIVKLDGSAPGFVHAVLLRIFVNGLISAIPYAGSVYSLVDILMIFREDRRCVHDMIAGTRVVKA